MQSRFLIYGLIDPFTGELRYIGRSSSGLDRPRWHWKRHRLRNSGDHCHTWVRSVLRKGSEPEVEILQDFPADVSNDEINEAEIFWIAYFRFVGCRLTNMTDGGQGNLGIPSPMTGMKHSPETRKKISEGRKGIPPWCKGLSKENNSGIARQAAAVSGERNYFHKSKGRKFGGSKKGRIPWNKGKKGSQPGVIHTEAFKLMMSQKMTGRTISQESRAKMSDSQRKRWAKRC